MVNTFKSSLKSGKKPLTLTCHRLFLWLFITSFCVLSACSSYKANAYNIAIQPENITDSDTASKHKINILSSYLIKLKTKNSLPITELSDLAWDEDEQLLYVISDEGLLYHLGIDINNNRINNVKITAAMPLLNQQLQPLKGKFSDAEGLSVMHSNNGKKGDSQLIISFENKPRLAKFSTQGQLIKQIKTVKKLRKRKFFRAKNKALESVALHPIHGVLTAAEQPLKALPLTEQAIYSAEGREWYFAASKTRNSSITALEVISKDKILILERAYNGLLSPVVISLRQLNLDKCNSENFCETKTLARLDTSEGWILDNFEGLTRINNNQYLMVSDNNNNPLQKTILVLFEIIE